MLAHAGAADESLAVFMLGVGLWTGWAALSRLRGTGFPRMPLIGAWALGAVAILVMVAALVVPRAIFPRNAVPSPRPGDRPTSTAILTLTEPSPGSSVAGQELDVVMTLEGARIVETTTTALAPDTGHIHLSLDGKLVSMTYGLVQVVDIRGLATGKHTLRAEFVAADHGPFAPRVIVTTTFVIGAS